VKWWFILPVVFLALVQSTITSFNLLLFFLLVMAMAGKETESLVFGFLGGILLDLLTGSRLGISSLSFLLAVMAVILYKRKFSSSNLWFWLFIFLLSGFLTNLVAGKPWHWQDGLVTIILVLPTYFILSRFDFLGLGQDDEGIKLKL